MSRLKQILHLASWRDTLQLSSGPVRMALPVSQPRRRPQRKSGLRPPRKRRPAPSRGLI